MAENEADDGEDEDFKYIVRVANTDLDGHSPIKTALTSIKGVGPRVAYVLAEDVGIDPNMRAGDISDEDEEKLREAVETVDERLPGWMVNRRKDHRSGEDRHLIAGAVERVRRDDINRLKKISCYRGVRHELGQKVRGQRTRSNGRSGLALGVSREEQMEKAQEEAED